MLDPNPFDRFSFFDQAGFVYIGSGESGGKAQGLIRTLDVIDRLAGDPFFRDIKLDIPASVVLRSQVFDRVIRMNHLDDVADSEETDERIAHRFLQAELPPEFLGDLRTLAEQIRYPLAVRSSSILEDALQCPLAGLYLTKMIPNHQPDPSIRFLRLCEAIKLVMASTYFRSARQAVYHHVGLQSDKMAVLIQQMVGTHFYQRFYPHLSGVARSYNPYSMVQGGQRDGIVSLAVGLGKTIVDGGKCWMYNPASPASPPPFNSIRDMLDHSQRQFWAVHMGLPPPYNPVRETEYLIQADLTQAEYDGILEFCASTYNAESDRLDFGISMRGPRMIDFSPLLVLKRFPLNETIQKVLQACRESLEQETEIEFAVSLAPHHPYSFRFSLLQVRPIAESHTQCRIDPDEWNHPGILIRSDRLLGNGEQENITDLVYIKPETFSFSSTRAIAAEIVTINRQLVADHRSCILIGFGRWGSADPFLGIPVKWEDISAARVIIEAALSDFNPDPSQGSHFFHNLMGLGLFFFQVPAQGHGMIDWNRLEEMSGLHQTQHLRHIRVPRPFKIKADSRHQRGVIYYE